MWHVFSAVMCPVCGRLHDLIVDPAAGFAPGSSVAYVCGGRRATVQPRHEPIMMAATESVISAAIPARVVRAGAGAVKGGHGGGARSGGDGAGVGAGRRGGVSPRGSSSQGRRDGGRGGGDGEDGGAARGDGEDGGAARRARGLAAGARAI